MNVGDVHFNSHPHEEDDQLAIQFIYNIIISTHILTKRMTIVTHTKQNNRNYFNSHPHEEDDHGLFKFENKRTYISTHILTKRMT